MTKPPNPFRWFDSSPEVIRLVVMMYVRYPLSLRNVEDLLFERGIDICHETVRLAARNNRGPAGLPLGLLNAHRGNTMAEKTYHGSCHCGAVAFEAKIDFDKGTTRCNCSICTKSRFWFAIVQADDFKIEKGEDQLSDYTWIPPGKSEAHLHYRFCETCGVRTFARGDNASAGGKFYAVAIAALDDIGQDADQVAKSIKYVDGRHDDYGHKPADTRLL